MLRIEQGTNGQLYTLHILLFSLATLCVKSISFNLKYWYGVPIPVAERSKAWVCSRSPAGIASLNPAEGMDVCLL
jgi:hypothetical protein